MMAVTKGDLLAWVQEIGLDALKGVFGADVAAVAGPKGKHRTDRTLHC